MQEQELRASVPEQPEPVQVRQASQPGPELLQVPVLQEQQALPERLEPERELQALQPEQLEPVQERQALQRPEQRALLSGTSDPVWRQPSGHPYGRPGLSSSSPSSRACS